MKTNCILSWVLCAPASVCVVLCTCIERVVWSWERRDVFLYQLIQSNALGIYSARLWRVTSEACQTRWYTILKRTRRSWCESCVMTFQLILGVRAKLWGHKRHKEYTNNSQEWHKKLHPWADADYSGRHKNPLCGVVLVMVHCLFETCDVILYTMGRWGSHVWCATNIYER